MVQADYSPADIPAGRIVISGDQRPHAGICPQNPGLCQARSQFGALRKQEVNFVRGDSYMVAFLVRYLGRCRSDDADSVPRDEDIGIGRLTAAVYDDAVDPVGEYEQGSLGREHSDIGACHQSDVMAPYSTGIDSHGGIIIRHKTGLVVQDLDTLYGIAILYEGNHF